MSLGRGFSIPQDKGAIRNGDPCIPLTPEKPILKRSSHLPAELQPGSKNWQDLLGIYTGFLQDETCNGAQQNFTRPGLVGQNQGDFINRDVGPIEELKSFNQNNGNGGSYIKNYPPTGLPVPGHQNHGQHSNRDVAQIENFGSFNQNARNVGSYVQHLGNDIPQKVNSLVELLGTENAVHKPSRIETANRSSVVANTIPNPHSQVLTNRTGYKNTSSTFQQNHSLHVNQDVGGYSLQQIPTDGRLVNYRPNYNLNLPPPRTEAGASTSTVRLFQLGPVTPDQQNKSKNFQPTGAPHWLIDEILIQENDDIENVFSQQPKIAEKQSNQLLQNIVDEYTAILKLPKEKSISDNGSHLVLSQPPEIVEKQSNQIMPNIVDESTSTLELPKENSVSDDGNHEGIDLSKTPQQKPPRRRKHRPKVVVEGKPKRTPKPTTKNNTPDGNPSGKRKYVRKKDIKSSTTPLAGVVNEVGVSNVNSAEKSCRRMLNFVLENGAEKQSREGAIGNQEEINEKRKMPFTWNLDSHNAEGHTGFNAESTSSSVKELHQSVHSIEKRQTENIQSFVPFIHHTPQQLSLPFPSSAPSTANDHTLNVIARRLSMRNANINQRGSPSWYSQVDHQVGGVRQAQFAIQTHTNETKVDGRRQPMLQTGTQLLDDLVDIIDRRGSKREYSQTEFTQPETSALMGSRILCQRVYETGYYASETNKLWQDGLETSKRKKVDKFHVTSSSTPSNMTFEHCSRQVKGREINSVCANGSTLHLNGGLPYSDFEGKSTSRKPDNEANKVHDRYMNPGNFRHEFQQQLTSSRVHSCAEHMVQKVTCHANKAQSSNSLAAILWNQESSSQRGPKIIRGNEIINSSIHLSVKEQTARLKSFNQALNMEKVISKENKKVISKENKTKGYKGSLGDGRRLFSVDDIIDSFKSLNINSSRKEIVGEEQGALVPYKQDGAIVPYEEFDPIKKRRPRPKVDLDPETNRLWNLLMGKEGSESTETTDKNKEKWWEEERNVFRGRVDSFIARMHLVQGDRRFSKWKGSVVDSVVGVFLTQNVSDHLSSSAFMCLAAKFPLKSTIIRQSCYQNEVSPSVEEHEVQVTCPDGTITYDHSTITSNESCQYRAGNVMTGTRNFAMDKQNRRAEEDVISSQSSSDSLVFQANEDIRSSSGSNSEAEDQISVCNLGKNRGPLNLFEQAERMAALQEYRRRVMGSSSANKELPQSENLVYNLQNQGLDGGSKAYASPITSNVLHHQRPIPPSTNSWLGMTTGLEEWESNFLASPGKESISSLASTDFENTKTKDVERSFITQQTGRPDLATRVNHTIQNKCLEPQINIQSGYQSREGEHSTNCNRGSHKTIQQESNFLSDCTTPAEAFNEKPSDNFLHLKNKISKPDAAGQVNSSTKPTNWTSPTSSNARKTKVEKEKREACHWDELRKQAQLEVGKRERTEETMDSLDYEALRKADVREISETIKERGMNNMLAERIKDFLNRLVEDHGGIDLEWLRDVPPEKSKDYLLSIRGLGLKSVECVRLLTLHNLAFPVDTNVGRIAVRLGWVPLQSLPEELQLHLLELYPVLESIQKYLWPRLCKLDQKTLYELHYQMITFGKVFCTKKQPNCNACPMRGECRHFASAFASARLALPGLEEKSIVASTPQTTAKENPGVTIKPMSLPPVGDNSDREAGLSICEPIIEEPTTPEPPMELSETDIEDAFYEDPDEIPTIKLNIEQFATNLQTFMQEQNMETKETNLSKALVALRPEFASIPTPKLKSMSRLRTEHQVYELPDDHPLLKGMERREADDPSPYLLAIWTPGETADSIQPPESKCNHQELGGLCDKKMCFSCNSIREEETQTVRGTLLIPCRTAMRGSFPLNGTYFQVNEVFADHESSLIPVSVPRNMLWSLPRRTVFFGTSVSTIFKGLTTEGIQYCFWRGFVCVRGFEQKKRAPRPLVARLHYPASRMAKKNEQK